MTINPYLLKSEKAYYMYLYLTDPLRILFLWALFLRPTGLLTTYVFYLVTNILIWARTGFKDSLSTILIFPVYKLALTLCRLIGNFYWFKEKLSYFRMRLHRHVPKRKLLAEYGLITAITVVLWTIGTRSFIRDFGVYRNIKSSRIENVSQTFDYDDSLKTTPIDPSRLKIAFSIDKPVEGSYILVGTEKGDTDRAIVHKSIDEFIERRIDIPNIPYAERRTIEAKLLEILSDQGAYLAPNGTLLIQSSSIEQAISPVTNMPKGPQ